MRISHSIVAV